MDYKVLIASCAKYGGIYTYEVKEDKIRPLTVNRMAFPMYMQVREGGVHIIFNGKTGTYARYIFTKDGLEREGQIYETKGDEPCHLDENGDIFVVNYGSGNIVKLPEGKVVAHEGKGINPARQESAHTHACLLSPQKDKIFVTDLGTDEIYVYDTYLNELNKVKVPDGYGPRHLAFSDDGKILYCVNELISSISVFEVDGKDLKYIDTTLCPLDYDGENTASAIRVVKDGLYIANRGENTLNLFRTKGKNLEFVQKVDCRGNFPRDFDLSPDGKTLFCCNQFTNDVTVFTVNEDGTLVYSQTIMGIENPLCVAFA